MSALILPLPQHQFLQVRLPAPVLESLRDLAKEQGCSVAKITRRLIAEELERNGKTVSITLKLI